MFFPSPERISGVLSETCFCPYLSYFLPVTNINGPVACGQNAGQQSEKFFFYLKEQENE